MRVLVTGARGFIGTALLRRLVSEARWQIRASSRTPSAAPAPGVEWVVGPDLSADADWGRLLGDVNAVVHLAARVHVMAPTGTSSDDEFDRVNVEGTRRLAEQAAAAGATRFVFLSSVKVHGERGTFTEDSAVAPADAYAVSKLNGEEALRVVASGTGLEVVMIRPPLVYGPGAQANFRALLSAVRRGRPLPLGAIVNQRSLVGVDNLADLIAVCLVHPAAASEAFLVSDGEDVSTPELVRRLASAVGREPWLLPVPVWCLRAAAGAVGKSAAVARLTSSLRVETAKVRRLLDWAPPVTLDEGLRRAVQEP